jgi:hypothetical protein
MNTTTNTTTTYFRHFPKFTTSLPSELNEPCYVDMVYDASNITYISSMVIENEFDSIKVLQDYITQTLCRWNQVDTTNPVEWKQYRYINSSYEAGYIDVYKLVTNGLIFELDFGNKRTGVSNPTGKPYYYLTLYAVGRFRRGGSSVDYYEEIMNSLYSQIKNREIEFDTMEESIEYQNKLWTIDFNNV